MSTTRISGEALYQKTVLPNGLRILTEQIPSIRSISIGVWIDVGSRHETAEENGVSHLIEHMLFKGTKHRNARQIAAVLESVGGSLNAFTSKEQTCYTARVLDDYLDIAVDVLADLTCNATLTPLNLAREKKVILEEIHESLETPADHIHDIFSQTYWGGHPLGRPILGEMQGIRQMPRSRILSYMKRNYRAGSIVISAAGSISHRKLVKLVREKFTFLEGTTVPFEPARRSQPNSLVVKENNNNQIHVSLGFPGVEYGSDERMPALVAHTYLGGGMSSALFQKIREEKGLAYSVYTFNDFYRDAGIFGAYVATDKRNLQQCIEITLKVLSSIKHRKLPSAKLDIMKAQVKGQVTLGMESTAGRQNRLGRTELMLGRYITLKETLKVVDRVSAVDIMHFADRCFDPSQMAIAVLGPARKSSIQNVVG